MNFSVSAGKKSQHPHFFFCTKSSCLLHFRTGAELPGKSELRRNVPLITRPYLKRFVYSPTKMYYCWEIKWKTFDSERFLDTRHIYFMRRLYVFGCFQTEFSSYTGYFRRRVSRVSLKRYDDTMENFDKMYCVDDLWNFTRNII